MFAPLPASASFTHAGGRDGHEVVFLRGPDPATVPDGAFLLEGATTATEEDAAWSVAYCVAVDPAWRTTRVVAVGVSDSGRHELEAEVRDGRWWVDGSERPDLDGCVDIDLETSLVTNTLAVHRLDLSSRGPVEVPAAFVRADDLRVERLEQTYRLVERHEERIAFDYTSPTFDVACRLVFDTSGLVIDYPGIGSRHR